MVKFTKNTFLEQCPNCKSFLIKQTNDSGMTLNIVCEDCGEETFIEKLDFERGEY